MAKQVKKQVARKPSGKIADARKVRFGSGMAPAAVVRSGDPATRDGGAVRFGSGMISPSLRK